MGVEAERRLRVEIDIDADIPIDADGILLAQAVANVLENAVEAYPREDEGPIFVAVRAERRRAGTLVAIEVRDHGCGLEEVTATQVGGAFVSSKGAGRGLGVLNIRKMVEVAHGGTVDFVSKLGAGTSVTFVLPRKQGDRDRGFDV
jgi:signal transduction histidine kinase